MGDDYSGMYQWGLPSGYGLSATGNSFVPGLGTGIPNFSLPETISNPTTGGSWLDSIGGLDGAKLGLGAITSLANAFMSMQQYGLAKKTLAENQRQFNLNYGAQRDTINTALRDRQAARVASNPGAYESVDDYMRRNAIK
jgi:hypothetical protein